MHLRLTDQELATLVEMVSLAAHVATWNQKDPSRGRVAEFEDLESKILERAGHTGLGDWIEFDEETQRFRVKKEIEERLFYNECLDEFRDATFWDELALRMSDRDLGKAIGFDKMDKMSEEQRRKRTSAWEKRYWDEFTKHGIERMAVITPSGEG
ncbi:MAG: hypothetical protein V4733_02235 [Verrucomicrobiota bacterium]